MQGGNNLPWLFSGEGTRLRLVQDTRTERKESGPKKVSPCSFGHGREVKRLGGIGAGRRSTPMGL